MSAIPCEQNKQLQARIREYVETLRTQAHTLGEHGLSEDEFYNSGLFRGAIERIRGQFSASMQEKRELVQHLLNHLQDHGYIQDWNSAGAENRHDYSVIMKSGRIAVIELKGCLDGNNTNIFERPQHAQEFIIWSVCTNPGADPQHNVWSGLHTRLSAEIISRSERVDGVIVWDMVCGTLGRPCPKLAGENAKRAVSVGPFNLPPPCIYVLPATIPAAKNNPNPPAQKLEEVEILKAFADCFGSTPDEINYVTFATAYDKTDRTRSTTITRNGQIQRQSAMTAIRRT